MVLIIQLCLAAGIFLGSRFEIHPAFMASASIR